MSVRYRVEVKVVEYAYMGDRDQRTEVFGFATNERDTEAFAVTAAIARLQREYLEEGGQENG